ncbi:hypothetical protein C2845_PM18G06670 [Panicum miliaceum]|uniref:NHL repeat-containing protein 2 n=1 Tax=Panicum miliaceum TaxID=4540 RepID=A0A3L6PIP5_PANMI|nr:hypothetical protein C2845_PM18G06670 [Panicum miliaceum]
MKQAASRPPPTSAAAGGSCFAGSWRPAAPASRPPPPPRTRARPPAHRTVGARRASGPPGRPPPLRLSAPVLSLGARVLAAAGPPARDGAQIGRHQDGLGILVVSAAAVDTVFDGSKLGMEPHAVEITPACDLLVLDSINSTIYRVQLPLSPYSRPKLFAGSPEGLSGHVDGRLREARMNHPKGFTVDDRGKIYVADAMNMAIRKISETAAQGWERRRCFARALAVPQVAAQGDATWGEGFRSRALGR